MITRYTPPFRSQVPPQWRGACAAVAGGGPNRATAIVVARLVFTISGQSRAFTALRLIDLVTAMHSHMNELATLEFGLQQLARRPDHQGDEHRYLVSSMVTGTQPVEGGSARRPRQRVARRRVGPSPGRSSSTTSSFSRAASKWPAP